MEHRHIMPKLFNAKLEGSPKVDPKWGAGAGLSEKIETSFVRFFQRVMLWGADFTGELLVNVIDYGFKILKPGAMRMFDPVFEWVIKQDGIPAELKAMIERVRKEEGEAAILGVFATVIGIVMTLFGGAMQPISRRLEHITDVLVRSFIPGPGDLSMYKRLGIIPEQVYQKAMWNNGVPEEFRPMIEEMSRNIPTQAEIIAARWRGVIGDPEFASLLKRLGYDAQSIAIYDELSKQIPPISDLIHFMVREAFNDAASSKFSYDDDYPSGLNEFFAKIGYDPDWGKRYWRAHWNLPSPTMAYDMLHRKIIDIETMDELLKTADYPKFWRDKLIAMSYHVLTRVDVRRLAQAGMIGPDKVLDTYQRMGYSPEDAQLLTDFALKGIAQEERDLTRSDIIGSYVDGLIDGGTARTSLVKMGYDEQEANAIMVQADFDIAKAARTDAIQYAKERYTAKKIDRGQATSDLTNAGLKTVAIERYLLAWDRAIEGEVKIPTRSEGKTLAKAGIITEDQYRTILKQNKYTDQVVEWFVSELRQEMSGGS